ncbi:MULTISPECIES: hypothetical protein [unclassified Mesorhizobium]|uniref:hypothetical protein n=1 Tax=unclassified Mesorhizobium TaxID=325217 RepID=UPI001CCDCE72|nr:MULTISPECIES: hypothetical protein [unclassified Mesorhizobium]MBZ9742345.1 hypothetical protein [Mesorhizobium sp. CO1-1-4]MBZ9802425.1 hypothetical protein [Mesorhizobium sp. ES1-6]
MGNGNIPCRKVVRMGRRQSRPGAWLSHIPKNKKAGIAPTFPFRLDHAPVHPWSRVESELPPVDSLLVNETLTCLLFHRVGRIAVKAIIFCDRTGLGDSPELGFPHRPNAGTFRARQGLSGATTLMRPLRAAISSRRTPSGAIEHFAAAMAVRACHLQNRHSRLYPTQNPRRRGSYPTAQVPEIAELSSAAA